MPKTDRPDILLDELLLELQLISAQQLNEFTELSKKTGLALGKTLLLSHAISEKNLEKLLKLQAIYRGCKIPRQLVLDAYRCSVSEGLTVEEGLAKAGVFAQIISFSRLGLLLVDAKLITKDQLDEAQKLANETRFPLGKTLTMHGAITQAQLSLALDLQRQMRERKISKDEALSQLTASKEGGGKALELSHMAASAPASTDEQSRSLPKISLVELLVISGIITEHDADAAFEESTRSKQPPETILKQSELVPASLLDIAIELQESINGGDLNAAAAAETLNYIANYELNQSPS